MEDISTLTVFDAVVYPTMITFIMLMITVLVVIMAFFNLGAFRRYFKPSLVYASIVLVLTGTGSVIEGWHTDIAWMLEPGEDLDEATFVFWFTTVVSLLGATLIAWLAYIVASGEWQRVRPDWQLALTGPRDRLWRAIGLGAVAAVGLAVLTELMMSFATVEAHPIVQEQMNAMSGLSDAPWWVGLPYAVGTFAGAGFYEELLFRGALLGVLLSRLGHRASPWLLIVLVAFAFGAMHLLNTTAPLLKFSQTAVIGLAAGWLAWRRGLESAISCHAIFNLLVVFIDILQGDV